MRIIQAVSALEEILALTALQCKCARIVNSHLLKVRQPRCSNVHIHTEQHLRNVQVTSAIKIAQAKFAWYSCVGLEKCK